MRKELTAAVSSGCVPAAGAASYRQALRIMVVNQPEARESITVRQHAVICQMLARRDPRTTPAMARALPVRFAQVAVEYPVPIHRV